MRLLLDQHYSPPIAKALRERGHDVASVEEEPGLRGRSDREVWSHAIADQRALLTEDVSHFVRLVREWVVVGERHSGVHFESSARQRRHPWLFGWPLLFRVLRSGALR